MSEFAVRPIRFYDETFFYYKKIFYSRKVGLSWMLKVKLILEIIITDRLR